MIFLVVIVVTITFYSQYQSRIKDIENSAKSKEAQINRYIDLSKGFIDLMSIYGNNVLLNGEIQESELYSLLQYDSATDSYNLDAIEGTKYQKNAGNLTGLGNIPESGALRKEINLALGFNQQFDKIYNKIPDVAWLYYTSKNNFVNIYPWVSSKEFMFGESLKAEKFYTSVDPDHNLLREALWTPVYLDHAGKGLMVTLSSPIYDHDMFTGAVSLDITNRQLSDMIVSEYEIYIIDDADSIIASSLDLAFETDILSIQSVIKSPQTTIDEMKKISSGTLNKLNGFYVYSVVFNNAPWKMFFRIPVWMLLGRSVLYTLPVFAICLLLLLAIFEVERRKNSENLLVDSLNELKSYQKLLENAAKYDFLTGTVNRRGLMEIFNTNINANVGIKPFIHFIMSDIDHFKQFNDKHGHAAGDKVLVEIAGRIQKQVTNDDVVCRWGGEEFLIMLVNRTYDEAMDIAERIREEIEKMEIPWDDSECLHATMTLGVAKYDGGDVDSSISMADNALYTGKLQGRNQVVGEKSIR